MKFRYSLLFLTLIFLSGCFRLTGIEHSIYANQTRSHSGGEVFSESASGHEEKGGSWTVGTKIKTIWSR